MSKKDAQPSWSTKLAKRWPNGMCQGVDGSMWLYRKLPLGPVDDAVDTRQMLEVARPLNNAFSELERLTRIRSTRRRMVKSQYREVHALLINVPQLYVPDENQPLRAFLAQQHPKQWVDRRLLLFGVKIKDDFGGHGGIKGRIESLAYTLNEGGGVPMEDYLADYDMVDRGMKRSGLELATEEDFALADAWWNLGKDSATPILPHDDHFHVCANASAMSTARGLEDDEVPCEDWPKIPGHHKLAMMAFRKLEFTERTADNPGARWASLIRQEGAAAVSVRGLLEPSKVTKDELRRNRNRFRSDIREQAAADKMERAEMLDTSEALRRREEQYSQEDASPSLIDTSVIVAMNGADSSGRFDATGVTSNVAAWSNMLEVQDRALEETMLCSKVRANPLLKDVPVSTVSYSGLPSLSVVGDREGALLGFTERDHRPAYVSHKAAYVADSYPILLVAGAVGSGKTQVLQYLAWQWAQLEPSIPQVVLDPKTGSDLSDIAELVGGEVFSLDDLAQADGVFDPLRFAGNSQSGIEVATSMLLQVDPWPDDRKKYESALQVALKYGVDNGATCIGQALNVAQEAGLTTDDLIDPIIKLLESSAMFRACVGMSPDGEGLRVSNGLTYIKVGNAHLDLPPPGRDPENLNQRLAVALVRMMVFGSAMAMTGRNGVLHFDEAWVAMAGGATEVERLGRLARSQTVLPVLYTQRVSDAVNNGLAGYISRGLILHIADPEEAEAACALFKLEPDLFVPRITMGDKKGGSTADIDGAPEWSSLKPLKENGKVVRGSVAIYRDLIGRAVPVTVTLPSDFLELSSTNPDDIKRKAEKNLRESFDAKQRQQEAQRRSDELGSAEYERMTRRAQITDETELYEPAETAAQSEGQTGSAAEVTDTTSETAGDFDDIFAG
ncbi:ATP-binding protein [Ornithinimicrobium murale]|uniref:ATP-binding protein n=1 Tax=Ornithinimicrobium murale TaxID=1050153 RepID=UPI000E0D7F2D|nr:ATP-binding protein [Ornithinimicrobium murale]